MSKILAVGNAIERTDIFKAIEKGRQKFIEDTKKFKENGGLCLKCGEHPGDSDSTIYKYYCKECNQKTQDILDKLHGVTMIKI